MKTKGQEKLNVNYKKWKLAPNRSLKK